MVTRSDRVASETLGALHRDSLSNPSRVRAIFQRADEERGVLHAGINRRNQPRTAEVIQVDSAELLLAVRNVNVDDGEQIFFSLELADALYFFACSATSTEQGRRLRVTI